MEGGTEKNRFVDLTLDPTPVPTPMTRGYSTSVAGEWPRGRTQDLTLGGGNGWGIGDGGTDPKTGRGGGGGGSEVEGSVEGSVTQLVPRPTQDTDRGVEGVGDVPRRRRDTVTDPLESWSTPEGPEPMT